ncbi:hypothetical protein C8Q75DRAFT_802121 [Abortiporus biennis]|nr:hypothetical protein C8Q75DRAFT_802121 [Abortiporus biennis]
MTTYPKLAFFFLGPLTTPLSERYLHFFGATGVEGLYWMKGASEGSKGIDDEEEGEDVAGGMDLMVATGEESVSVFISVNIPSAPTAAATPLLGFVTLINRAHVQALNSSSESFLNCPGEQNWIPSGQSTHLTQYFAVILVSNPS